MAALESAKFADAHISLNQTIILWRELEKKDTLTVGLLLSKIGETYLEQGKLHKAEVTLSESLEVIIS